MKIDAPQYILAIDCETSGLVSGKKSRRPSVSPDGTEEYQAIAWGVVVAELETYDPVEVMSKKIKLIPGMQWSAQAEKIHGISKEQLELDGVEEEDFIVELCELVMKYWGTTTPVIVLGHNVAFDLDFLQAALARHGVAIHFSNRIIDSNSIAMGLQSLASSDQMFEFFQLPKRTTHDPLDDILMTLIAVQGFKTIYQNGFKC